VTRRPTADPTPEQVAMARWVQRFKEARGQAWAQPMLEVSRAIFDKETRAIVHAASEVGYSIMPSKDGDKVYFCRNH